jgi:alpha-methylacyl-CoA racemase
MLHGITVLDLSTFGPGARCTRALADYGARVVKIEAPGAPRPTFHAYGGTRGIERVELDLKADDERAELLRMAGRADVFVESYRPGVVDRLGIGYDALRAANPRIVYCSTSGYGQDGPRSHWAGHDLNYLAVSGFLHCSPRDAHGVPALPGATVADIAAGGMHAALSIVAALYERERTGVGRYLDVSVADGALWMQALAVDEHLATGTSPGPGHDVLTGRYACYGTYGCADGRFVAVGAIEPKFFANLCARLGVDAPERQYDDDAQDALRDELRLAFASRTRDDWVAELAPNDCCVAPVLTVDEVGADDGFTARGAFVKTSHPEHGEYLQVGPVLAGAPR